MKFDGKHVFLCQQVPPGDVRTRTLRMSVYDVDRRRIRHSLGHVIQPLSEIDLTAEELITTPLEENMMQVGVWCAGRNLGTGVTGRS